jgi:hypothetical protein
MDQKIIILIVIICCCCISISISIGVGGYFLLKPGSTTTAVPTSAAAAPKTTAAAALKTTAAPKTTAAAALKTTAASKTTAAPGNLKFSNTNKCIRIRDSSKEYGAQAISWDCNGGDDQQFKLTKEGQLIAKHSGRCLFPGPTPPGGKLTLAPTEVPDGRFVSQGICSKTPHWSEKWSYDPDTKLIKLTGSNKCLVSLDGNPGNGNNIGMWECNKEDKNQLFLFKNDLINNIEMKMDVL